MNNVVSPLDLIFGLPGQARQRPAFGERGGAPISVREENDRVVFEMEMPGVKAEDFDISFEKGVLTVQGEKASAHTSEDGFYSERAYGTFRRSVTLGDRVDVSAIDASYNGGVLTITAPIREESKPQRIAVRSEETSQIAKDNSVSEDSTSDGEPSSTARESKIGSVGWDKDTE